MNNLYKAAEKLKHGWCQGFYREQLTGGEKFCASGALTTAMFPELTNVDIDFESKAWNSACNAVGISDEALVLAKMIVENYPEAITMVDENEKPHPVATIINFNDNIATSSDDVIAMFEKAAAQMDERV